MYKLRLLLVLLLLLSCQQLTRAQKEPSSEDKLNAPQLFLENTPFQKAEKLRKSGKVIAARPYYQKIITASAALKQWESYALYSAYLAESYIGSPNYHEGIAIAIAGIRRLSYLSTPQPELGFKLYSSLARLHQYSFESQKSVRICVKALRYLRQTSQTEAPLVFTKAYIQLGMSYAANAQWEQALQFYEKAEAMLKQLSVTEANQLRPKIYAKLGSYYAHMWDFIPAAQYLEYALEAAMLHKVANSPEVFNLYQDIATVYQRLDENEKAIAHFEKAAYLIETSGLESDQLRYTQLPMIYLGIAKSLSHLHQFEQSIAYCHKTQSIIRSGRVAPFLQISMHLQMARTYIAMNRFEKANILLKQAKTMHAKQLTPLGYRPLMDKLSHQIDFAFALLSKDQEDFEKAKVLFNQVYTSIQAQAEKDKIDQQELSTYALTHLAEIHMELGQQDSAFYYNHLALMATSRNFDESSPMALPAVRDCTNDPQIFQVLQQKAELFKRAALLTSAKERKLSLLENGLKTIALLDEVYAESLKKAHLLRDGQTKTLIHQSEAPFQTGIDLAVQHYAVSQAPSSLEKAFYYAEKMKAQQLSLSCLKNEAINLGQLNQTVRQKEQALLEAIIRFEKMIEEARLQHDTAEAIRLEHDLLFCKKKEYAAFQRDLEEQFPEYSASKYSVLPEEISSLQEMLEPEELLINYVFVDSQLFIFTLTRDRSSRLIQTAVHHALNDKLADIHQMLKGSSMMRRKSRESFILLAHELYLQLLAPIQDQLQGRSKLVIIGDGMTNYLPFEVLLETPKVEAFHKLDFLIKSYEISYHYSASLLAKARRKQVNQEKGIFAFAPVYNEVETIAASPENKQQERQVGEARGGHIPEELVPLPESQHEVVNIIKIFASQNQDRNTLALRNTANESILKRHLLEDYKFIHIAGHSFANLVNPNFSGIACYEDYFGKEDGVLYSGEIYHLDIKADLVTLSSCESGYGKLERNEGMLGLNHAFLSAGTPNVVFSLWKIYDKISAQLMVDFYEEVLADKNYTASLREAKLRLLDNPVTAAPHYWSPYLLIGR
ncbi:MAG: CHAT domain-containing protein [Saprospiraceae bacterium]|nr:CHAT domain-containing protein [Saprospiraceae bacterium]